MSDHDLEEETYSLVFRSLRHPIRRRILRMLADEPMTFSQILKNLSIDSGHLNYHLENLGDLISHTPDREYRLSSIGVAATRLMGGIEEQTKPIARWQRNGGSFRTVMTLCVFLLAAVTLLFSLYFLVYITAEGGTSYQHGGIPVSANGTFVHSMTLEYGASPEKHTVGNGIDYHKLTPPITTLSRWDEDTAIFSLKTTDGSWHQIKVYGPDGKLSNQADIQSESGTSMNCKVRITGPGTYRVEITTLRSNQSISGTLTTILNRKTLAKPYCYQGILGLTISMMCPAILFLSWRKIEFS